MLQQFGLVIQAIRLKRKIAKKEILFWRVKSIWLKEN